MRARRRSIEARWCHWCVCELDVVHKAVAAPIAKFKPTRPNQTRPGQTDSTLSIRCKCKQQVRLCCKYSVISGTLSTTNWTLLFVTPRRAKGTNLDLPSNVGHPHLGHTHIWATNLASFNIRATIFESRFLAQFKCYHNSFFIIRFAMSNYTEKSL